MYKNLLLSQKGGIVDTLHRLEQDNCAVVAIGLGGTGVDCLKNLKAKVYNRVTPDNIGEAIPTYNHIKFLAVDTDKTGLEQKNRDLSSFEKINLDTEYHDISFSGDITEIFRRNSNVLETSPEYREWLNHKKIRVLSARSGACGIRQMGRYLFMQKSATFVQKVRNLVNSAKSGLVNPDVYVHIFSGMGGGTGAGTFLDACYLTRKALEKAGADAHICGYFFQPDINIEHYADPETQAFVAVNGYASMTELDYCMNFECNGDKWSQNYPGIGLYETTYPPVDICHLISGRDVSGNIIPNAYDYAMNVVTDYFMEFIVRTSENFTMKSHIANFVQKKANIVKNTGAQYEYCVLGGSNAALPYKEILTYLSSYLFSQFANMSEVIATQNDLDTFKKSNGLTYEQLFNMLNYGVDMSFPAPDISYRDAYTNDNLVTTYFADLRSTAVGTAAQNLSTMSRDINNLDPVNSDGASAAGKTNVHATSIVTKIFHALFSVILDPQKGPYFASSLIQGTSGNDLVAMVDDYIELVNKRISQLEINLDKPERQRTLTQSAFFGANHASRDKFKKYVAATKILITEYTKQDILYKMKEFLLKLRKQLVELSNRYYRVYCKVMTNLIETFTANKSYLEKISDNIAEYEYPIATINELKPVLDDYLKNEFDLNAQMTSFQNHMLTAEGYKAWNSGEEGAICKYVSAYFSGVFQSYTNKGMTAYLMDKYDTEDIPTLIEQIRNDILNQLDDKAKPMYWTSALYTEDQASPIAYTSVPIESAEVKQAADRLQDAKEELVVRETSVRDRISIMRCYVGAPLFGYNPLSDYEKQACSTGVAYGTHLYEGKKYINESGKETVGRDWRTLPSPIPYSHMNRLTSSNIFERAKNAAALYDKAEELKIIYNSAENEYAVRVISDEFFNSMVEMKNRAVEKGDPVSMYDTSEKLKKMIEHLQYDSKTILIPNDAKNGTGEVEESVKRKVRVDHFVAMPEVVEIVKQEISRIEFIDEMINELTPKVDNDFEDFANALFTGAVKINGIMLTYENDFFEEVKLSAPNMPMGGMRLYQAFVSFKELDDSTKEKLKSISEKRNAMEEGMDCIIDACKNVKDQLDQKNIAMALRIASSKFPSVASEIKDFYDNLSSKFDEYTMTYGLAI